LDLLAQLDQRPIVVCVAGPNGAGKTTFYEVFLEDAGLRYVNADDLARELDLDAYTAADVADRLRREFVARQESFIFETVFSDPVGAKVEFLEEATRSGFQAALIFIGLVAANLSEQRVSMRASQGGHDVPTDKLIARYPRSIANLERATKRLPLVLVYDNSDLRSPYTPVAHFDHGSEVWRAKNLPRWFPKKSRPR
jgi:predicted ABC-type ATPase